MGRVGTAAVRDGGAALPHGFWAAVRVWLEKPQVANRRLCGAAIEAEGTVSLGEASVAAVRGEGSGGGQEGPAASAEAAELGRLWWEVRGQLPAGHGNLPSPLTPWGGPGRRSELRAVLRTLLPRGRPVGSPAPPVKELAVQGEREPGSEAVSEGGMPGPAPKRVVEARRLWQTRPVRECLAIQINAAFFPTCASADGFLFLSCA